VQVELRIRDSASHDRLRAYVERRLRFALSRFGNRVGRVVFRMSMLDGVQGVQGTDEISCHIEAVGWSLAIIALLIGGSILLSLRHCPRAADNSRSTPVIAK
jgi:hypothetical protein